MFLTIRGKINLSKVSLLQDFLMLLQICKMEVSEHLIISLFQEPSLTKYHLVKAILEGARRHTMFLDRGTQTN